MPSKEYTGPLRDYNGDGRWAGPEVLRRYAEYARRLGTEPRDVSPHERDEYGKRWIYPVMDRVVEGIKAGDPACVLLGIELIEEDAGMPFGRILKAHAANALRRASLTEEQKWRIRRRVLGMLRAGYVPREYERYTRLLARIGFDSGDLDAIEPDLNLGNPRIARFHAYLRGQRGRAGEDSAR